MLINLPGKKTAISCLPGGNTRGIILFKDITAEGQNYEV